MIKFDVNINFPILHRDIIKISKVMKEMNSDIRVYKNTDTRVVHGNSEIGMLSLGMKMETHYILPSWVITMRLILIK